MSTMSSAQPARFRVPRRPAAKGLAGRRSLLVILLIADTLAASLSASPESSLTSSTTAAPEEGSVYHKRDTDSAFDDFPDNKRLSAVDRLKRYPENERLIASIPSRIYEVIYPVQVRHHQKVGISTRDVSSNKTTKHYHQTSLLIKAFHYKFRLELELNDNLLKSSSIPQKHLMPNGNWRRTHQEIEHCYYHGIVKDYPSALAAFRTCNGISGVIHIQNETFVIHPFYGGDLSRVHPHVIYKYYNTNATQYLCGNTKMHQWGFKHFRKPHSPIRYKRDVREVVKYIELALVLDKAMFDVRNASQTEVMADAIQIINCVDMYFRQLRTRVSIVYIETWQGGDQIEKSADIKQTLINFLDYSSKNLYQQHSDARHLLTGKSPCKVPTASGSQSSSCPGIQEVGMAIPDTICTAKAVGVSEDTNVYEPHLVASTVTHMLGHNLGMNHDSDSCACDDPWGCIMTPGILGHKGSTHVQPSHFSKCSYNDYISHVRVGHGVCLFNKPGHFEDFRTCGNGIVEDGEQCDCGTIEECGKVDPCCDPITCRLRMEANCSTGACCDSCKLRPAGHRCRPAESECDFPEFCDGQSGDCPTDVFRQNGAECKSGAGYCFGGRCETPDEQCEFVWGFGATKADDACFEYNLQGMQNGNCGEDLITGGYIKCTREHMMCGSLQCQRGGRTPVLPGMEKYTRMNIAKDSTEYECKSVSFREEASAANPGENLEFGLVFDGTKCGEGAICVNRTCQALSLQPGCPGQRGGEECSGRGVCSNQNTCYCSEGYTGYDCGTPKQTVIAHSSGEDDSASSAVNNQQTVNKHNTLYNTKQGGSTTANPAQLPTPVDKASGQQNTGSGSNQSSSSSGSSNSNASTTPAPIVTKKSDGSTSVKTGNTTTTYVARKDALGAPSLVMVLVSVVGGVFIFFALLATCYRRSTMPKLEPFQPIIQQQQQAQTSQAAVAAAFLQQQKAHRPSMMGGSVVGPLGGVGPSVGPPVPSHPLIGSTPGATPQLHSRNPSLGATTPPQHKTALLQALQQLAEDRIITFGSMPSYREDKLKLNQANAGGLANASRSSSRAEETFVELSPNNLDGPQQHTAGVGTVGPVGPTAGVPEWGPEADTLSEVEKTLKSLTGYTSDANTHSSYSYHEEILEALQHQQQQQQQQQVQQRGAASATPAISPGAPQDHKATAYAVDDGGTAATALTGSGSLRFRNLEDLLRQLEQQPEEPEVDRHYASARHHALDSGLRYLLQGATGVNPSTHGSRCHSRASGGHGGAAGHGASPGHDEDEEAEESEESSNTTYSAGQIAQQIQQRLRSASVEAIPIGGFPSPPSEESGSYDGGGGHTLPPLIPGPPVSGKRKVKRRRLPEYKV